jgi:hypothetical protein
LTVDDFARVFGIMSVLVWVFAFSPFLLLGLAIPYIVLRVRNQQSMLYDSQLGLKAALYYFFSLSILLIETGLTVIAIEALSESVVPTSGLSGETRTGLALVLAGLLGAGSHLLLIKGMTNEARFPIARRLFVGWRFAINGLVVMGAGTALLVAIFQNESGGLRSIRALIATLLIWLPSWGIHLVLLHLYRDQPPGLPRAPEEDEEPPLPPLSVS